MTYLQIILIVIISSFFAAFALVSFFKWLAAEDKASYNMYGWKRAAAFYEDEKRMKEDWQKAYNVAADRADELEVRLIVCLDKLRKYGLEDMP
jgi:hypothetical protein